MVSNMPDTHMPVKHEYAQPIVGSQTTRGHNAAMKNLVNIRKARRLSQQQLAEKIGANQATISKIEKGDTGVTLRMIYSIADALNTTPIELFGLSEMQQKLLETLNSIDPDKRAAALVVLDAMARNPSESN